MIPILYESTETVFNTNGLGRLAETIECSVKRGRNGIYECEFVYPMNGKKFSEIQEGRIIAVTHDESGKTEPFDIYGHSAPIDGKVTFYAHHISYRLGGVTVKPFTASSCADALAKMKTNSINENAFDFWTDKDVTRDYSITYPRILKELLGGEEGSILDVFGTGEYDYTRFDVKLYTRMGTDTDVTIRYGKNLVDLIDEVDFSDAYNGIVPFWAGQTEAGEDITVTLPEWVIYKTGSTWDGRNNIIPYDFSGDFEEEPTESELRTKAQSFINNNDPRLPVNTLNVDFVQLWQTEEYKDFAPLEKVGLCDTVRVIFDELGIDARLKVVETDWNVLLDRYNSLTLGDAPQTYAEVITDRIGKETALNTTLIRWVQGWATNALKIASDTNQYFWFTATGTDTGAHITEKPREEFIVDPTNGGSNLLARSNGIAVRDGLAELAVFGANGAQVGLDSGGHSVIDTNGMRVYRGTTQLGNIGYGLGTSTSGTANAPYYSMGERTSGSTIGNYSMAEGYNTTASAHSSHAEGNGTTASEFASHAEGFNTTASQDYSHAEGRETAANGNQSHAEGLSTTASGQDSHAEGYNTTASGAHSHAEGDSTTASGYASHAEGSYTTADGSGAHAEGYNSTALGNYSHAEGQGTIANGSPQHAEGIYNVSMDNSWLHVVGNGYSASSRSNAMALTTDGNLKISGALYTGCSADSSGGAPVYGSLRSLNMSSSQTLTNSLANLRMSAYFARGSELTVSTQGYVQVNFDGYVIANGWVKYSGLTNGDRVSAIIGLYRGGAFVDSPTSRPELYGGGVGTTETMTITDTPISVQNGDVIMIRVKNSTASRGNVSAGMLTVRRV